jgi:hypothetical protein
MVRIDAQSQPQGIEGHLHNPGGGESIAKLAVGHAHDINALRQALKQGRDGIAHASSPGGVIGGSRLTRSTRPSWIDNIPSRR